MAQLSDNIEQFIKELMREDAHIELRRNELAHHFGCAPSQINYVLATRFSLDHGYIIESRRGGGGYIRIVRVCHSGGQKLLYLVQERIGNAIGEPEAARLIGQLAHERILSPSEANIMRAAVSDAALAVPMLLILLVDYEEFSD